MKSYKVRIIKTELSEQLKVKNTTWYAEGDVGKVYEVEELYDYVSNKHMVRVLRSNDYILKDHCTPVNDEGREVYIRSFHGKSDKTPEDFRAEESNAEESNADGVILSINGKVAHYFVDESTIHHELSSGVVVTCNVPKNWEITRVCKFMESLLKSELA